MKTPAPNPAAHRGTRPGGNGHFRPRPEGLRQALFALLFVFFVGAVTVMMVVFLRYGGVWFGGGGGDGGGGAHGSREQQARNRAFGA